jgi:hypothetical protein
MKGQITVEYFVSMIVFVIFTLYIYHSFSSNIPKFIAEIEREDIRSKAYQVSEVLLNDFGDPEDWYTGGLPNRLGLSDEVYGKTNLLSSRKIDDLQTMCSADYDDVQNALLLQEPISVFIFRINSDGSRSQLLSCEPPEAVGRVITANVRRITAYVDYGDGGNVKLAEMIIQV